MFVCVCIPVWLCNSFYFYRYKAIRCKASYLPTYISIYRICTHKLCIICDNVRRLAAYPCVYIGVGTLYYLHRRLAATQHRHIKYTYIHSPIKRLIVRRIEKSYSCLTFNKPINSIWNRDAIRDWCNIWHAQESSQWKQPHWQLNSTFK